MNLKLSQSTVAHIEPGAFRVELTDRDGNMLVIDIPVSRNARIYLNGTETFLSALCAGDDA